jgi:hypothetical protein
MFLKRLSIAALSGVAVVALVGTGFSVSSSGPGSGQFADSFSNTQVSGNLSAKTAPPAVQLQSSSVKLAHLYSPSLTTSSSEKTTYKVKRGDSLSKIALKFEIKHWERLYCENKKTIGNNPGDITPGMKLLIGKGKHCLIPAPPLAIVASTVSQPLSVSAPVQTSQPVGKGYYSYSALESLWESAGGPSSAAPQAAQIAECESGGNPQAYNPSGATGLWQILGQVVPGNLDDPFVNALNAVFKFHESGDTFAQWVCQ